MAACLLALTPADGRQLAKSGKLTAIVDDGSPCRASLPVTVRTPNGAVFEDNPAAVEKLIGGIRIVLEFECQGQPIPQRFEITGESGGLVVYSGGAEAANGWVLQEAGRTVEASPPTHATRPAPVASAAATAASPEHRCDELAAHPDDPDRPAGVVGVSEDGIDPNEAAEACTAAVEAYPDEPRFAFQLGRVLMHGGETELATSFLSDAAAGGSAAALAYLGDLEDNPDDARDLYEAAADGGFAPARAVVMAFNRDAESSTAVNQGAKCDELAAHPEDPARPAGVAGVADAEFSNPMPAFEACAAAVTVEPDSPRYQFQLGRSLLLMDEMQGEAENHLRIATEKRYAAAAAYLAGLVADNDQAIRLLRTSLAGGFAPAQPALAAAVQAQETAVAELPSSETEPEPPRSARKKLVFDSEGYEEPQIVGGIYTGDFNAITFNTNYVRLYLSHMTNALSQFCPLAVRPSLKESVMRGQLADAPKTAEDGLKALMGGLFALREMAENPSMMQEADINSAVMPEKASYDAGRLSARLECDSVGMRQFLKNLERYMHDPGNSGSTMSNEYKARCMQAMDSEIIRDSDRNNWCDCFLINANNYGLSRAQRQALAKDFRAGVKQVLADARKKNRNTFGHCAV